MECPQLVQEHVTTLGKFIEPAAVQALAEHIEGAASRAQKAKDTVAILSTVQAMFMKTPKNPATGEEFTRASLCQRCRSGLASKGMTVPSKVKALLDTKCDEGKAPRATKVIKRAGAGVAAVVD